MPPDRIRQGFRIQRARKGKGLPTTSKTALVGLFIMNALWAIGYPVTTMALNAGASPAFLAAMRLCVAFVLLAPYLFRIRHWSWRLIGFGAALGVVGFSLPVWLQTIGIDHTNAAVGALSIAVEPLFTIILAALIMRVKIEVGQRLALILALAGSWILTGEPRPGDALHLAGDVSLFAAIICFAIFNVYSEKLFQWVDAAPAAALVFGFGALGSIALWALQGGGLPDRLNAALVGSVAYMAFGATGAAYLLWLYAVGSQSLTVATLFLYTQPLLGTLLSWGLGQTRLTVSLTVGGVLVMAAMALGQWAAPPRPGSDERMLN